MLDVANVAADEIRIITASEKVDKLASFELKGALILPTVAQLVNLPCVVVRKKEKKYGATARTAGAEIARGEHILFFDDVISEGLSKFEGIRLLEDLGATVKHLVVVVDREEGGIETLAKAGYKVHALAKISELTKCLLLSERITEEQANAVFRYGGKLSHELKGRDREILETFFVRIHVVWFLPC